MPDELNHTVKRAYACFVAEILRAAERTAVEALRAAFAEAATAIYGSIGEERQ